MTSYEPSARVLTRAGEVATVIDTKSTGMTDTLVRVRLHKRQRTRYSAVLNCPECDTWDIEYVSGAFATCRDCDASFPGTTTERWVERLPDHEVWVASAGLKPAPTAMSMSMFWTYEVTADTGDGEHDLEITSLPGGWRLEYTWDGVRKVRRVTSARQIDALLEAAVSIRKTGQISARDAQAFGT